MNRLALFLAIAVLVAPTIARAQTENLGRADAALSDAWTKSPLTVQHAVFVAERPSGYGIYKERPSEFKPGESIITYAEPVAFGYKELAKDAYEFGFTVDLVVKAADGKVIGSKEGFAKLDMQSHRKNREFMLTLTLDLTGVAPGAYKVEYRLHDDSGNKKSSSFELPFSIVK